MVDGSKKEKETERIRKRNQVRKTERISKVEAERVELRREERTG